MSLEAPIQIDLSQENGWDQLDDSLLTPEDKAFLREQFQEAREGILYLTREEIAELRQIIQTQNIDLGPSVGSAMEPELDGFIEAQISEGLSSGDIIQGVEGENLFSTELLDSLDRHSHTLLFGNSGVFSGLENISNTAKDQVSVSLTLSLMESLRANPTQLQNMIEALPETDIAEHINQVLGERLSELSGAIESNPDIEEILGNGEQNAIFMNTETGREFFSGVLDGSITRSNMISEITRHGSRNEISPSIGNIEDIRSILTLSREEFTDIIASGRGDVEAGESSPAGTDAPGPELPPEVEDRFARLRESGPLGEFLASILEFLEGLNATFGTTATAAENTETSPEEGTPTPEVTPTSPLMTALRNISTSQLGSINRESLLLSLADSETQTRIMRLLENLIPEMNLEDTITHLFTSDVDTFSNFQAQLVEADFPALTSEVSSSSPLQQFEQVLQEYSRYRQSEGVQGITEGGTTWENYAQTRRSESWATV